VEFPITRQDVAEMTGTTLFTVSRILSNWESQGLVAGGRERISIREPAKLREIADRAPE
jgi:CRP-like cAMP-binding protein